MPATETIASDRLVLTPLDVADADEMVDVLSDPDLYAFTGGEPPSLDQLQVQYRHQTAGSPRADEEWHNWIVRLEGISVGFVQATVSRGAADLAWVVGTPWQGKGYATESSRAMRDWLVGLGVSTFFAHIHTDHAASEAVAAKLGMRPTGRIDDGEMIWG
jgi:RimJ/RimL family protein N-acetyltransferase